MKKVLLSLSLLLVIGTSAYFCQSDSCSFCCWISKNTTTTLTDASSAETVQELKGIKKAINYMSTIRSNQETGKMHTEAYYKALAQAEQQKNQLSKTAPELEWEFLGPNNVGGRTRALLIDRNNPNHLIAGSTGGGIWVSTDGAQNWSEHPQNQELPNLVISSITQATNGDIYVGTGEGLGLSAIGTAGQVTAAFPGTGIYKSTDGGDSFNLLQETMPTIANNPGADWSLVNKVVAHPSNPNIIYAALANGAFVSEDAGANWISLGTRGIISNFTYDIVIQPSTGDVFVTSGTALFRSTDNGASFNQVSGNDPGQFPTSTGRKILAISPSDNNVIYAAIIQDFQGCLQEVVRSTDGGNTWISIGTGTGVGGPFDPTSNSAQCQGNYDLALTVDPANPNRIFFAGVTLWVWVEENGASSWSQLDNIGVNELFPTYVHADKHTIVFHPTNPNIMYIGSDGGVARSTNAQSNRPTFQTLNKNYNVTQFYTVAAGIDGRAIGGTQDNGTPYMNFRGNAAKAGFEVLGGDGADAAISILSPNGVFASIVSGALRRSSNDGDSFSTAMDENLDCNADANGRCTPNGQMDNAENLFVVPFELWEDYTNFPFTGEKVARMFVGGSSGNIFMTENPLEFNKVPTWEEIGGFEDRDGSIGIGETITAIAVSADGNIVYAGSRDGRLLKITRTMPTDSTVAFVSGELTIPNEGGRYVTSLCVDPFNAFRVLVGLGNYNNDTHLYQAYLQTTNNPVFTNLHDAENGTSLPAVPVYSALIDRTNPVNTIVATDLGIFTADVSFNVSTNGATVGAWSEQNTNIGRVPILKLRQAPMNNAPVEGDFDPYGCQVIYAATYGKGIFRTTSLSGGGFTDCTAKTTLPDFPLDDVSVGAQQLPEVAFTLAPNPMEISTTLNLTLQKPTTVQLAIYDVSGRLVSRQELGQTVAGSQSISIDRGDLTAGIYMVSITTEYGQSTKKLMVK